MARRRRRSRKRNTHPYGLSIVPIGFALFLLALIPRLLLSAEGLAFESEVQLAEAVATRHFEWPVVAPETPPEVAFRSGLVVSARAFHGMAREWAAASDVDGVLRAMGAVGGALVCGATVWLAAVLGLGRLRSALAGFALALSPLHVSAGASGDPSGIAVLLCVLALGGAVVSSRQRSVPIAAVAGLTMTFALGATASSLAAFFTCLVVLVSASEKRRWIVAAYALTAAPGLALALPGSIAMVAHVFSTASAAVPLDVLRALSESLTPVGIPVLLVGAGVAMISGRRAIAVAWLAATLLLHVRSEAELAALWAVPAAILIASASLERWRRALVPLLAVFVVVVFAVSFRPIAYRHDRVGPVRVARTIATIAPGNALVIAAEPAYVRHYAGLESWGWPAHGRGGVATGQSNAERVARDAEAVLAAGRAAYVLRSAFLGPGGETLEREFRERFAMTDVGRIESESPLRGPVRLATISETIYELSPR